MEIKRIPKVEIENFGRLAVLSAPFVMNRFVGTATARLSGLRQATGCAGYALYPCPAAASLVEQQRQRHCTNPLKTEFLSRRSRSRTFLTIASTTTPMPLQTCAQCTPVDLYQRWLSLGGVRTAPQGQSGDGGGGKDEWLKNRAGLQFLINIFSFTCRLRAFLHPWQVL